MSVRKGLVLLLAVSTFSFLVGCGGSSSPHSQPPPSGAFSPTSLNGTYVFSTSGRDSSGTGGIINMVGSLVANGSGGVTSGTVDLIGASFPVSSPAASPISSGSYTLGVDGRGQIKFNVNTTSSGSVPVILDFVLTSSSHGLITEFDGNGSGSGTIDQQPSVIAQTALTGLTFGLAGAGPTTSVGIAGTVALNSAGTVTSGFEDVNNGGTPSTGLAVSTSSSVIVGSGTTPGTAQISTSFGLLLFDVYAIDSTHLKLIETDSQFFLSGDGFTPGTSLPTSSTLAFTMAGFGVGGTPLALGGLIPLDANSQVVAGQQVEDFDDGGNINTNTTFTGGFAPIGGGRSTLSLNGFVNFAANDVVGNFSFAAYPFSSNGVDGMFLLEVDGLGGISSGAAYVQTGTTLAASAGYGLNLSGIDFGGSSGEFEEDDIAEFSTTSTAFTGVIDVNDEGGTTPQSAFNGSYQTGGTGRYFVTLNTNTNANLLDFNVYVVNSSTFLIMQTDTFQSGTGILELQNSTGSPGPQPGIAMVHAAAHAHAARATGR